MEPAVGMSISLTKEQINQLSEKQKEVYQLIMMGYKRKEIIEQLSITVNTYKSHIYRIREIEKGATKKYKPRTNSIVHQQIAELYSNGYRQAKIAVMLNLTRAQVKLAVRKHLHQQKCKNLVFGRQERGITTEYLAQVANIDHQTLIDIENGDVKLLNDDIYKRLMKILHIDLNDKLDLVQYQRQI